jgi:TonB-linked SusC/RagA family outer membrane protein
LRWESPKLYYEKFTGQNSHIPDGIDWERAGGAYEYQNGLINGEYQQSLNREYRRNLGHQANLSVDYDNTFGKHNVHVYVGLEDAKSDMTYISGNAVGFLDPTNRQFGASLGVNDVNLRSLDGGVRYDRAMSSFISRADYNFRQKYIVGFTLRGDASYKFPKDSQIGWFPAASVGWNIAKEPFFNPLEGILSQLKLRGSYGMTGSDNTAAWQWQNVYTLTPATVLTENDKAKGFKLQPSYTPNQLITWEKNYSSNIGIDMSMPNRLVTFSADWWTRKTTDILGALTASIPVSVGASLPAVNYGSGKSWGWGFTVGHNNTIGDFKYSINANASTSDSKYLVIDQAANVRDYENLIGLPMRGVVRGYVLDVFIRTPEELAAYVEKVGPDFRINGQIPKMGDIMYKDIRGLAGAEFADEPDGKITKEDQEILSYNGTQKWRYGISSQIAWKGLSLSLIMDGTFKHKAFIPISNLTQTDVYADMWSPDHPTGTLPIPPNQYAGRTDKFVNSNLAGSAFWLKDWSYLRVKNISLSYSISEKLLSRTKFIKGLRVNGNIENPFYIINPFDYISPAQGTGVGNYPVMKAYSAGVTVTF